MLDRNEILRYIGAPTGGDMLGEMIDRAEKGVIAASRPKHVFKHIDIAVNIEKGKVNLAGTDIGSRDLAAHLNGCNEGFLFACTLGVGVDSLVKRYGLTEIYMLPVVQATAAAYTEYCADSAQKEIETYASRQGAPDTKEYRRLADRQLSDGPLQIRHRCDWAFKRPNPVSYQQVHELYGKKLSVQKGKQLNE